MAQGHEATFDGVPSRRPLAFVSYSSRDSERAQTVASLASKSGFRVWIDSNALVWGQDFAKAIKSAIEQADVFVVCLSPDSVESPWVVRELQLALSRQDEVGRPRVLPLKISPVEVPDTLRNVQYLDASASLEPIEKALRSIASGLRPRILAKRSEGWALYRAPSSSQGPPARRALRRPAKRLTLAAIGIAAHESTQKYYGGNGNTIPVEDVHREQRRIQKELVEKSRGMLANFVQDGAITETGGVVLVKGGEIQVEVDSVVGPILGSQRLTTVATAVLISPDKRRVLGSLPKKIGGLGADSIQYTVRLSPAFEELGGRVVAYFRDEGSVTSHDVGKLTGITSDGCTVSVSWSPETLRLRIPTTCFPLTEPILLAERLSGYDFA